MQVDCSRATASAVRRLIPHLSKRTYAVSQSYVPSSASSRILPLPPRAKPTLPTFFTGRPIYENALLDLENLVHKSQSTLRQEHVYPLPPSLKVATPRASWLSASDLSGTMATHLKTAQYRRITTLLNELATLREIARRVGQPEVLSSIGEALKTYERADAEGSGSAKTRPDGKMDEFGRSLSVGKRKESSARVWMIQTKLPDIGDKDSEKPASWSYIPGENAAPHTEVLVNSRPIFKHFPRPSDRELILRPLRLTGLLGHYNIFALAEGGGTSGQAGAVALGVARGVVTHRPEMREVLQKDGLLTRDPRMVERKKTNLAKARKRNAWVKR